MIDALVALGFGASLISIFARLGGGIFTKGADVGADLVGKVEAGIPEDDPRNPAVIADNVGDNVGDCAGMAADLFETYVVTVVATMVLALIYHPGSDLGGALLLYPLAIGGVCIIASIVGTFFVRLGANQHHGRALQGLHRLGGHLRDPVVADHPDGRRHGHRLHGRDTTFNGFDLFWCGIVGLLVTGLIVWVTEYYTGTNFRPGPDGRQGQRNRSRHERDPGPGGLHGSHGHAGHHHLRGDHRHLRPGRPVRHRHRGDHDAGAGRHGGGAGRLWSGDRQCGRHRRDGRTRGSVRNTTDALDAVGNTTKAVTKGYAIGSAGLGALVLFAAYTEDLCNAILLRTSRSTSR